MQWNKLRQSIGYRVRVSPIAYRLDEIGRPLPEMDEDWLIQAGPTDETIQISRIAGHSFPLAKDQIHHFTSDPIRTIGDMRYGMLTLLVQIYIQSNDVKTRPTVQPGVPVPPPEIRIEDRAVDFRYPTDTGLQQRLETAGYKISWVNESRLARLVEIDGWEIVIEQTPTGLARFRAKDRHDDQVLVKKWTAQMR
jgi:hypothetical protein